MRKITMMLLLATAVLAGCKKEDEVSPYISVYVRTVKAVYDNYGKGSLSSGSEGVGTTVYVYKDLAGYLSNQPIVSALALSKGDKFGYALLKLDRTLFPNADSLYIRAVKDNLNSERYYSSNDYFDYRKFENRNPTLYFSSKNTYDGVPVSEIVISTTPTKLRLQVFDGVIKAKNYEVDFYATEAEYLSNKPFSGGTVTTGTTDINGEVELRDLQPQQYWFRVRGTKNNSTTTFKTPQALPDDANITTVIQVAIQ